LDEAVSALVKDTRGPAAIECAELEVAIPGRSLVAKLALTIDRGTVTCVLGCNGAGMTLTLHTLAVLGGAQV
jgi:ABC-type hemin transport system ATPase subunit